MTQPDYDEILNNLLIKKEYPIEELANIFENVQFYYPATTPTELYLEDEKRKFQNDFKAPPTSDKRPPHLDQKTKEHYEKKLIKYLEEKDKNIQLIEQYLIDDFHPKGATAKELFLCHCKRKAKTKGKEQFYGVLYGLLSWNEMNQNEKDEWENLKRANDKYWNVTRHQFIGETKVSLLFGPEIRQDQDKLQECLKEYSKKVLQQMRKKIVYILNNGFDIRYFFNRRMIFTYFFPELVYMNSKKDIRLETTKDHCEKLNEKQKDLYFKISHIFDIVTAYISYYLDNKSRLKLEETINAKYCYFMSIRSEIMSLNVKVGEKVKTFFDKWNELGEKEKKDFEIEAKQCFNRFYVKNPEVNQRDKAKEKQKEKDKEKRHTYDGGVFNYVSINLPILKEKYPLLEQKELYEVLSKQWKEMNDLIKKQYFQKAIPVTGVKKKVVGLKKKINSSHK